MATALTRDFLVKSGLTVQGTTEVTSSTGSIGTLQVNGGASVAKSLYVGNNLVVGGNITAGVFTASGLSYVTDATAATVSPAAGALQVTGGIRVGKNVVIMSASASTSTTDTNALYVVGGVGIGGTLVVGGTTLFKDNVTFNGTATYVYSTNTVYTDNIIEMHTPPTGLGTAWTLNDGKDIGLRFHYYDTLDRNAFLGRASDSGYLEWYQSGTEDSTSTFASGVYGTFKTGSIVLANSTVSNSTNTGALQVVGGVGIGGALYAGSTISGATLVGRNLTGGRVLFSSTLTSGLIIDDAGMSYNPDLDLLTTTVTSAQVSNNIAGGTAGNIHIQSGSSTTAFIAPGSLGNLLQQQSGNTATFVSTTTLKVGYAGVSDYATIATNLQNGSAGQLPYQTGANATAFIATGTTGYVLQSNGTAVPSWVSLSGVSAGLATTASNLAGGFQYAIPYQTSAGATSFDYNFRWDSSASAIRAVNGIFTGTTNATSTITGAIQAVGGIGVGGNVYAGASVIATNGVYSIGTYTGSYTDGIVVDYATGNGRISVGSADNLTFYTGGIANTSLLVLNSTGVVSIPSTISSTTTNTGALTVTGGVGIGGTITAGGIVSITNTTAATSTSTGALQVAGGASIAGTLWLGGDLDVNGTIYMKGAGLDTISSTTGTFVNILVTGTNAASSTITGALQVVGGVGVGGSLFVGGIVTATTFVGTLTGAASQVQTVLVATSATYYPTFVDSNNASSAAEIIYTTSSFMINPGTGGVGIGVVPISQPLVASQKGYSIELGSKGNSIIGDTEPSTIITTNAYQAGSGGWKRGRTDYASYYQQLTGKHTWWTAPFDTIDTTATFTQSMVLDAAGILTIYSNTGANSTTTGALQVVGGVGIGGGIVVGGITTVTNTTAASSTITGALQVVGGAGIGGNLYVGGTINAGSITGTSTTATNIAGGLANQIPYQTAPGVTTFNAGLVFNGTTFTTTNIVASSNNNAINATSTGGGALVVVGGATVTRDMYVGGITYATNSANAVSVASGGLQVTTGGASVKQDIYVGGIITLGATSAATSGTVVPALFSNNVLLSSYTSGAISSIAAQNLDTFAAATYRSAKYFVQVTSGTSYVHISEITLFHDGVSVYLDEYGTAYSTAAGTGLGTFDATYGTNITLTFTPNTTATTVVKVARLALTVT